MRVCTVCAKLELGAATGPVSVVFFASGDVGICLRGGVDTVEVEGKEDDQMGKYRKSEFETVSRVSDVTQPSSGRQYLLRYYYYYRNAPGARVQNSSSMRDCCREPGRSPLLPHP